MKPEDWQAHDCHTAGCSGSTRRRHVANAEAVHVWDYPVGTPVLVARDNGTELATVTESEAFLLDSKHAMIRVAGIPGNTRLQRVTPKRWQRAKEAGEQVP